MDIPIDSGEIRYQFAGRVNGRGDFVIDAEFRGPRMGTKFEMELKDARQMRSDLDEAIRNAEFFINSREYTKHE